jgi:hypothetical protein
MKTALGEWSKLQRIFSAIYLTFFSLLVFLAFFRWSTTIWRYKSSGIDGTDEGYYISSVLFPNKIPHAPTDFAFYLRPFWFISGENLANYRVAGFIMIFASAAYFSAELIRWVAPVGPLLQRTLFIVLLCSTTAGLAYQYSLWIPTPGYNLLSLCLLVCSATSVLTLARASECGSPRSGRIGWSPLATSGLILFTLFATRITAAVFVSLMFILVWWWFGYLKNLRKFSMQVFFGMATGLILHTMLTLRPPWKSLQSWSNSLELSKLRKDHSLKVVMEFDMLQSDVIPFLRWCALLLGLVFVIKRLVSSPLIRSLFALLGTILTLVTMWASRPSGGVRVMEFGAGWWWLRLSIYGMLIALIIPPRLSKNNILGILIAALALIGAAGSANGIFRQVIFTSGLLLAGLTTQQIVIAKQTEWKFISFIPLSPFFVVFLLLNHSAASNAIQTPYRTGGTIWDSNEKVEFGRFGSMNVHPSSAEYVRWVANIRSSLPSDIACVVNLEGGTPSFAALVDIPPAGTIWDLGGYPGSVEASNQSLQIDGCWEKRPFLLVSATSGTRVLPVPEQVSALCEAPFSVFELRTDHKASMQASLCNQEAD